MSKRVLLHVGTPKTGTSHLQDVLFRNRRRLVLHGLHYPAHRFDAHFLAALDLMRLPWGGLEHEAVGAWDALAERVRRTPGTTIVSHEILAAASRSQAARAIESFGDIELHLVLSVRDLGRQIPAEWQENVKHRSVVSYARFLDMIRDPQRRGRIPSWFWSVQEIPDIIARWAPDLPPERVHLVTVPPSGSEADLLWRRFAEAFGLTGLDLDVGTERVNPSLGVPETALIRRINRSANQVVPPADYRPLVRELLAHQTLAQRTSSPRLALPPDIHDWVAELAQSWVAELRERGYAVVGDLDDLLVGPPAASYADPDKPRERQVSAAAVEAIRALLVENATLRRDRDRLEGELHDARSRVGLRGKVVNRLETSGAGRRALRLYRRARGSSSRSA
ncbi:hypothetical protein [Nocardioides sp.]|uniref:hypothetical protein n=1 Tax=Nocardioides sp. TaxID=35761 RepID=UPI0035271D64